MLFLVKFIAVDRIFKIMARTKKVSTKKVSANPAGRDAKINKAGRTGYYQPWMADKASELVGKLGATQKDLADFFDVSTGTIEYWMRKKDEFYHAVKQGRLQKALTVSQALYHRAIGYSHPDVQILSNRVKDYDEEGRLIQERTEPLIVPTTKHYPPDTSAAIKILTILMRETWADPNTQNINHNINGEININKIEELSMDDLSQEVRDMLFELNMKQLSGAQNN